MSTLSEKDERRLYGYDSSTRSEQKFSDDAILDALRSAHATVKDQTLTRTQYQQVYAQNTDWPHAYTIIRRFGKWSAGLSAAGIPFQKRGRYSNRMTEAECINAVKRANSALGHLPSLGEYHRLWIQGDPEKNIPPLKDSGYPSAGTIRARFKRWRFALEQAADET